ncbi:MAG TPA: hypothetical protein VFQ39_01990, partial [Longimicrobium sp.]|nr:hypothetical protein [Longimicrobium sp.]
MKNPLKSIKNPFAKQRKEGDASASAGAPMFGAKAEPALAAAGAPHAGAASAESAAMSVDEIAARLADP